MEEERGPLGTEGGKLQWERPVEWGAVSTASRGSGGEAVRWGGGSGLIEFRLYLLVRERETDRYTHTHTDTRREREGDRDIPSKTVSVPVGLRLYFEYLLC